MAQNVAGISIAQYLAGKANGSIKLQRLGPDTYQLVKRCYCPDTGRELPPVVAQCNLGGVEPGVAAIEKKIAEEQAELAAVKTLIADMQALEKAAASA